MAQVKGLAEAAFDKLAATSQEFGRLLCGGRSRVSWCPPTRLCDGGHPVLRAHSPSPWPRSPPPATGLDRLGRPFCARSRWTCSTRPSTAKSTAPRMLQATARGMTQRGIAAALGISQPAVQAAVALARRMEREGIDDPYVPLAAPPDDYNRLRRHRHPRTASSR